METPPADDKPTELKPCPICGRTFRPDALERHEKICQKTSVKKRKVFDSSKQRSLGSEEPGGTVAVPTPAQPKMQIKTKAKMQIKTKAKNAEKPKPKSRWREKHEEFIRTIRASRGTEKSETPNEPEPKSHIPSDYVKCDGCDRHFNERAAERHIPWCLKQKAKTPKTAISDDAKEKLKARTKYKVPPPAKIRKPKTAGSITSEKSKPVVREQASYSSPPSLVDSRSTKATKSSSAIDDNNRLRNRDQRNGSRGKDTSQQNHEFHPHIIKFKEKFPNRPNRRGVDLEESLSSEQLRELLSSSKIDNGLPRTVPGVRVSRGHQTNQQNHNDQWNLRNTDANNSARSTASTGDLPSSLNKQLLDESGLPEVSSSEVPSSWMGKFCWNGDLDASISSSGSSSSGSLPPLSRESPTDGQFVYYCHQCHSKFPLAGAKYCCECGARKRNLGQGTASHSG